MGQPSNVTFRSLKGLLSLSSWVSPGAENPSPNPLIISSNLQCTCILCAHISSEESAKDLRIMNWEKQREFQNCNNNYHRHPALMRPSTTVALEPPPLTTVTTVMFYITRAGPLASVNLSIRVREDTVWYPKSRRQFRLTDNHERYAVYPFVNYATLDADHWIISLSRRWSRISTGCCNGPINESVLSFAGRLESTAATTDNNLTVL